VRGQGNTIVAVLFFSIFVLSVVPLTLYIYTTANRPPAYEDVRYSSLSASLKSVAGDIVAAYNYVNRTLDIANRGGSDVNIERIVSFVTCENQRYMVDTRTSIAIPSGQDMSIPLDLPPPQLLSTCANPTIDAVYIVTEEGAIISSTIITREDIEAITRPVPVVNATVHRAISSVASSGSRTSISSGSHMECIPPREQGVRDIHHRQHGHANKTPSLRRYGQRHERGNHIDIPMGG